MDSALGRQGRAADRMPGMPVWAMPSAVLGAAALKQCSAEDLSDAIRMQTIGSTTASLGQPHLPAALSILNMHAAMDHCSTTLPSPCPATPPPRKQRQHRRPSSTQPHGAFCPTAGSGLPNPNCLGLRLLLALPAMLADCSSYKGRSMCQSMSSCLPSMSS